MDTENSQVETQTPKYKVGDLVWLVIFGEIESDKEFLFVQSTITALVYVRRDGKSVFAGYMTANERKARCAKEAGVFATREEVEALVDRMEADIKAELEGK